MASTPSKVYIRGSVRGLLSWLIGHMVTLTRMVNVRAVVEHHTLDLLMC